MNPETLHYRAAAVHSATPVQLACLLYDTLARDFNRIITAIEAGKVEDRASEVKHALLVLEQLEAQLDTKNGSEAAVNLGRLYAFARARILQGHARVDVAVFRELIAMFLDVRKAWEQADQRPAAVDPLSQEEARVVSLSCSV